MVASGGGGKAKTGSGGQRSRGRGGFRSAGDAARGHVAPVAERKGFAEAEVLLRWHEIVGAELAALCQPVKVNYGRGASIGATLMVRAEGAVAPEVEHLAPRILERINASYGYRAVARLTVTQATGLAGSGGFAEEAAPFDGPGEAPRRARAAENPERGEARAPLPVTPAARREAAALARDIANPALRDALATLGAFVLSRPAPPRRD